MSEHANEFSFLFGALVDLFGAAVGGNDGHQGSRNPRGHGIPRVFQGFRAS